MGREKSDKPLPAGAARPNTFLRGSSKDLLDNQSQEEQRREMLETVKQLTGGVDAERASSDADRNKPRELGEEALGNKTELALDIKFRSKIQGLEKQQFKTPTPRPGDPSQNSTWWLTAIQFRCLLLTCVDTALSGAGTTLIPMKEDKQ